MKIIYLNKIKFPSNMPATVFSTFNAYAFAQNGVETYFIARKNIIGTPKKVLEQYFDVKQLPNFHIKLFSAKFSRYESNEFLYLRAISWIVKKHRSLNFDYIITRDPAFLPYLFLLKILTRIKIVYQSHNFYVDLKKRPDLNPANRIKHHILERLFIPFLDGMLTLQEPQKELYQQYFKIPIFAGHPGLIKIQNTPIDRFIKKQIAYIGSFQAFKGVELAVNAFAKVRKKDWQLLLIGGRDDKEILFAKKLLKKYGIENQSKITGWLSYLELKKYLSKVSVGILPLRDTFYNRYLTAPSKLFDYLSFGIPIIASNLPSIRDFTTNGRDGYLVAADSVNEFSNAMKKILQDRQKYEKLSENVYKTAERFLWEKCGKKVINFLEKL
ncbi:MAG: glycosyltransferase [Candidatus Cloacimonadota bacterium]|nr:glycosyltransferase [Candidatus Cloacimonadota bacterium]